MTTAHLLTDLRQAGIDVAFDADGLRVRAPKGVLTQERRAAIKQHRDALLSLVLAEHDAMALDALDGRFATDGAEPEPLPEAPLILTPATVEIPDTCQCPKACSRLGLCPRGWCGRTVTEEVQAA